MDPVPAARRPRTLAFDLTALAIVGVLLIAAVGAAVLALAQQFYSPRAFVERYLALLAEGHAADALALPGVSVDLEELEAAGMPTSASDALLRQAALATLTDVRIISEDEVGDITRVTVAYTAGAVVQPIGRARRTAAPTPTPHPIASPRVSPTGICTASPYAGSVDSPAHTARSRFGGCPIVRHHDSWWLLPSIITRAR